MEEQLSQNGNPRKLWIPKGIVIPSCKSDGQIIRLKVRRQDWHKDDELPKYVAISGSMNGLSRIGDSTHKNIVVVESELDAYAMHHSVGDFVLAIAVGSCMKNPDNVTDDLTQRAHNLLICNDNDQAGGKMLKKWKKLYPHAQQCSVPYGKDIGEFIQQNGDISAWIKEIMKPALNEESGAMKGKLIL